MRITKKFTGSSCIGKQVFNPCEPSEANKLRCAEVQAEMDRLEDSFVAKLETFAPQPLVVPRSFELYSPELLANITQHLERTNAGTSFPPMCGQLAVQYVSKAQRQQHLLQQYEHTHSLGDAPYSAAVSQTSQLSGWQLQLRQQQEQVLMRKQHSLGAGRGEVATKANNRPSNGARAGKEKNNSAAAAGAGGAYASTSGEDSGGGSSSGAAKSGNSSSSQSHYSASSMRGLSNVKRRQHPSASDSSEDSDRAPLLGGGQEESVAFASGNKATARRKRADAGLHLSAAAASGSGISNSSGPGRGNYVGFQHHSAAFSRELDSGGKQLPSWSRARARIDIAKSAASTAAAGDHVSQVDLDASDLLLNFFKSAQAGGESPSPSDDRHDKDNSGDENASESSGGNRRSTTTDDPSARSGSLGSEQSRSNNNSDGDGETGASGKEVGQGGGSGGGGPLASATSSSSSAGADSGSSAGATSDGSSTSRRSKRGRDDGATPPEKAPLAVPGAASEVGEGRAPSDDGSNEKSDSGSDDGRGTRRTRQEAKRSRKSSTNEQTNKQHHTM